MRHRDVPKASHRERCIDIADQKGALSLSDSCLGKTGAISPVTDQTRACYSVNDGCLPVGKTGAVSPATVLPTTRRRVIYGGEAEVESLPAIPIFSAILRLATCLSLITLVFDRLGVERVASS